MPLLNQWSIAEVSDSVARHHFMDRNVVAWFQQGTHSSESELHPAKNDLLEPGLSLVICTYRRARSMSRFLDSLAAQDRKPDKLIIVDASPDPETEQLIRNRPDADTLAKSLIYFRVRGPLQGLTRQRNFGLSRVTTDLVAFFDDDVVFAPGCIRELEKAHREQGAEVAGVGAFIKNSPTKPNTLWKMRYLLRLVPSLEPGRYYGSGISTPWGFLPETDKAVEVDCLPGCAMTWKTNVVHKIGFHSGFEGYALGEDLDFSLRARKLGKLVLACSARLDHLHEPSGRPNHFKLGYMSIYNTYHIHRRALADRTWSDIGWFIYAWTVDTLMLGRHFLFPNRLLSTIKHLGGRFKATFDLVRGH